MKLFDFRDEEDQIAEIIGEENTARFFGEEISEEKLLELRKKEIEEAKAKEAMLQNSSEFLPTGESLEMSELVPDEDKPKEQKNKLSFLVDGSLFAFLMIFGIALISSIFLFQVWLTPIKVIGTSMQPSINVNVSNDRDTEHCDVVYFNKEKSYKNNDIVIVENKNNKYISDQDVSFVIKRVIACPNQTLRFFLIDNPTSVGSTDRYYYDIMVLDQNGNDIGLDQSYLDQHMYFSISSLENYNNPNTLSLYPYYYNLFTELKTKGSVDKKLGDNEYFVMGDNRNGSEDSRFFGAIDYEDISGSVKIKIAYGENIFIAIWKKFISIF